MGGRCRSYGTFPAGNADGCDYPPLSGCNVVTISAASGRVHVHISGPAGEIPFVTPEELAASEMDVMLVVVGEEGRAREHEIRERLVQMGFDQRTFLFDFIACVPGFSLQRYRKLLKDKLTIFSLNCFGGLISHSLGLKFRSPTVNLFFDEDGFIRMLRHPQIYFAEQLEFEKMEYEPNLKWEYPVFLLGDVRVYMNHYPEKVSGTETWQGEVKWYERVKRINWFNLFVVMYTDCPELAEQFDALPYGKKVCFVPFKPTKDSSWQIDMSADGGTGLVGAAANSFAQGHPWFYDPFDMLLYGKKTQLVEIP